jgi:hypothetical protein
LRKERAPSTHSGGHRARENRQKIESKYLSKLLYSLNITLPTAPILANAFDPNTGKRVRQFVSREYVLRQRLDRLSEWRFATATTDIRTLPVAPISGKLAAGIGDLAGILGIDAEGDLPKHLDQDVQCMIAAAGSLEEFFRCSSGLLKLAAWSRAVSTPQKSRGSHGADWMTSVLVRTIAEIWVDVIVQPIGEISPRSMAGNNPLIMFVKELLAKMDTHVSDADVAALLRKVT